MNREKETEETRQYKQFLADREKIKAAHRAKAEEVWAKLDANKRHGIRFGLFPVEIMAVVKEAGLDQHTFTCALMDVASENGGMRA